MLRNLLTTFAATLVLAAPALADDAARLAAEAKRTDRAAASAAAATVAERIAADFPSTFGSPEETRALIEDQRGGAGYGEIYISLALAQALAQAGPLAPGDALNEILARRREGDGWGKIARDLGLNLGRVVSSVRSGNARLETALARPGRAERAQVPERPAKPERPQRPERPDRGGRS